MAELKVYLENGFDHDRVTVGAGDVQQGAADVTTCHQVGLASVVELDVAGDAPVVVRVTLPERGIVAEITIDPAATPHVRVDQADGQLRMEGSAFPPMFA